MDHAAVGKKKFCYCGEWKRAVLSKDLGLAEIDKMDMNDVLDLLLSITDEEIADAQAHAFDLNLNPEKQLSTTDILEMKLGTANFEQMSDAQNSLVWLYVFGSCGGHKDLNAFCYGIIRIMAGWACCNHAPPVVLADEPGLALDTKHCRSCVSSYHKSYQPSSEHIITNKANDATIHLGTDADSAAVQHTVDSSVWGGMKLASLAGALFNHKSKGQGYQNIHRHFIAKQKLDLHGIIDHT
ncbi:hypothetical protein H0H81_003868 [Sphagnurus paluster]|uniref:Uncharacterized protein n=1 Tax=Sphagnurus paluster TaxID=117069 RepID=A0A9P7KJA2_9AGAR|nr:hypothetical protein H0H81_003868 [Sphagnurus paluster]